MTLFSYEIFDAVARQGSFNKAAQQLHLTPSAISHAIAVMAMAWLIAEGVRCSCCAALLKLPWRATASKIS